MAQDRKNRAGQWFILYALTGVVDLVQIVIDFTGIGAVVSEILEVITPILLIGLFTAFKIPIFSKINRLISIAAVDLGDAVTGGIAPFWILDVWYIHRDVKKEEVALFAQEQEMELISQGKMPLNVGGRRMPQQPSNDQNESQGGSSRNPNTRPLNMDGVRQPGA